MIVFKNSKGYETRSDMPDGNWLTDEEVFVVPDGSPLAAKIQAAYPHYDFVTDEEGNLTDVTPTEAPPYIPTVAEQIEGLKALLLETDYKIIKCTEYQLAGLTLPYDITGLHTQRQAVRDEINALEAAQSGT